MPFVLEERCWGCGFCEHHCPTRPDRAIVVFPHNEIRLESGSHAQAAQGRGLRISTEKRLGGSHPKPSATTEEPTSTLPPGFTAPPD